MTKRELIDLLDGLDDDAEIRVKVTLGDYSRTEVCYDLEDYMDDEVVAQRTGYSEAYGGSGAESVHYTGDEDPEDESEKYDDWTSVTLLLLKGQA